MDPAEITRAYDAAKACIVATNTFAMMLEECAISFETVNTIESLAHATILSMEELHSAIADCERSTPEDLYFAASVIQSLPAMLRGHSYESYVEGSYQCARRVFDFVWRGIDEPGYTEGTLSLRAIDNGLEAFISNWHSMSFSRWLGKLEGEALVMLEKERKLILQQQPTKTPAEKLASLPDDASMSHVDLAKALGISAEPLRKRLDRWRGKNSDGWEELTEAKARDPRYLYRVGHVRDVLRDAIESN